MDNLGEDKDTEETKTRMIHIWSPTGLHKEVRVRAAETDGTMLDGRSYGILILPETREDVLRFVKGEHALEA